jgi:hypothetical protein
LETKYTKQNENKPLKTKMDRKLSQSNGAKTHTVTSKTNGKLKSIEKLNGAELQLANKTERKQKSLKAKRIGNNIFLNRANTKRLKAKRIGNKTSKTEQKQNA